MSVYQWLCLLGVSSMAATIITGFVVWIRKQIVGVKKGVQALLRSKMIDDYNKYLHKGYAPIYVRQNFENCWEQYHNLGVNGVMDDLHDKFLELPTEPTEDNLHEE